MSTALRVDRLTVAGLALLLMPMLTMLHEIGGHAAACVVLGHSVTELGAFYVSCDAEGRIGAAGRLVALAGPLIDLVAAFVVYGLWRRARSDRARLILWYIWLGCGFTGAGYFAYSGITGIGDLGPGENGGIGPLPAPALWRVVFALGGGLAYWQLVRLGMRGLDAMIGQGPATRIARRTIAHQFYLVLCLSALLASLLNPVGIFITLASAAAASFGGHAGLISIGYATRPAGEPRAFAVDRSTLLFVAGLAASLAFAGVLGPSISFAG